MLNVAAVGSKITNLFQIEEMTPEAFEKGMTEAGWKYDNDGIHMIRETTRTFANGMTCKETQSAVLTTICIEMEMKYSEYKTNYSGCQTKKGSYDKATKTIHVYVPVM